MTGQPALIIDTIITTTVESITMVPMEDTSAIVAAAVGVDIDDNR